MVAITKYLRESAYKEKKLIWAFSFPGSSPRSGQSYPWSLIGNPNDNGGEHMTEQIAYLMARKQKRKREMMKSSQSPLGHALDDPHTSD